MKTITITVLLFFGSINFLFAQMVTHDAQLNIAMIKANIIKSKAAKEQAIANRSKLTKASALLKQSEGSFKRLSEIKGHYDKLEENITVVNDYILSGKEIYDIIQTFGEAERVYNEAERVFTNDDAVVYSERLAMIKMFSLIFLDITDFMDRSKDLTKSGAYKMSDNDRLLGVINAKNKIKKKLNLMRYIMRRYLYARNLAMNEYGSLQILNRSMEIINKK